MRLHLFPLMVAGLAMGGQPIIDARTLRVPPTPPQPDGIALRRGVLPAESRRRLEAAAAKRERRRERRLELAANARTVAVSAVALSATLRPLRDMLYSEELLYDLAERIVEDLLADIRWTAERICRDPIAAVRAWGGR